MKSETDVAVANTKKSRATLVLTSVRLLAAILCLIPAGYLWSMSEMVNGDIEGWLCQRDPEGCRRLAYEFLNRSFPTFTNLFYLVSICAALCIVLKAYGYFVTVIAGNVVAAAIFLLGGDVSDPAWHSVLCVQTIGMGVSLLVTTGLWMSRLRSS